MGSINLRRLARRPRIRHAALLIVMLLAAVTAVHHMQPEGADAHDMGGMHGMAAMVCLGLLVTGAVIAGRRGIARLARSAASIRWAPRLSRFTAATVPTTWLEPARDGPRRHLRLQVIRR